LSEFWELGLILGSRVW